MLAAGSPPSTLGTFLIGAAGIGLMLAVGAFEKWRRKRGYAMSAHESEHPLADVFARQVARAAHPLDTEVKFFRDENDRPGLVVVIRGLHPAFKLRNTGRTTGDVEVGQRSFDDQFNVQGETAAVRARLDGATREALLQLARRSLRAGRLTVADGQLRAVVPEAGYGTPGGPVDEAIPLLAQVARRLANPLDVTAELAKSARHDEFAGVRVLCLRTLLRDHATDAVVAPLVREAASDPDPEVRLEAALALGSDGVDVLQALVANERVEDALAVRAAESLGTRLDAAVARAAIRQELAASTDDRRVATAIACIAALGRAADPQDEPALLAMVAELRHDGLRVAAVRALGQMGSARAVPALAELASADGSDLRRAAREAIATIQSRLEGATPGQLSLDAGAAGQVAMTDDVRGRVSKMSEGQ